MGELILVKTAVAANPYYIDELSLNVYSLEELSYYIYHNVWLLNRDFMSVPLCEWIGGELGLMKLSDRLLALIKEDASITLFVSEILNANGYLTAKEIKDTLSVLVSFENKSEAECRKMRADRLFESGRIVDAVYEYENLLANRENMALVLTGDVRHNLGVCYSRLFFMKEAADCFKGAYEANRNRESLYSYLAALLLAGEKETFENECDKYLLSPDEKQGLEERVDKALRLPETADFSARVDRMKADYSGKEAYQRELKRIIGAFQEDYRRLCRI